MKRQCFIIRHSGDQLRYQLLMKQFSLVNSVDFYIIEEKFNDSAAQTMSLSPHHWILGRDYLEQNQLHPLKKAGWQCGDYIAYAARDLFKSYDYYWIMDDDVVINLPTDQFIALTDDFTEDCLACEFSQRDEQWMWYQSLAASYPQKVYGMLYCLVRLSASAIDFLKSQRRMACWQGKQGKDYPNDEAFTGTLLMNNGYACGDLKKLLPEVFSAYFTLSRPILVDEIDYPHTQGKVLHPICDPARCWSKVVSRVENQQYQSLLDRFYTCYIHLDELLLNRYFDGRFLSIFAQAFSHQDVINFSKIDRNFEKDKFPTLIRTWFYKSYILVFEFESVWGRYAIDIHADKKIFLVPRNIKAKEHLGLSKWQTREKIVIFSEDNWIEYLPNYSIFGQDSLIDNEQLACLVAEIDQLVPESVAVCAE